MIHFTYRIVLIEHFGPYYGKKQPNGSFTGLESKVQNNECLIIARTIIRDETLELIILYRIIDLGKVVSKVKKVNNIK